MSNELWSTSGKLRSARLTKMQSISARLSFIQKELGRIATARSTLPSVQYCGGLAWGSASNALKGPAGTSRLRGSDQSKRQRASQRS